MRLKESRRRRGPVRSGLHQLPVEGLSSQTLLGGLGCCFHLAASPGEEMGVFKATKCTEVVYYEA